MAEYVYPNCVSTVLFNGGRIRIHPDQQWPDDDPFVLARPELFDVDPLRAARSEPPVERGTRAPGERRHVTRKGQSKASDA